MKHVLWMLALAMVMAGCRAPMRGWQEADLPTHDRQVAFDAARDVLGRHFELAEANWARGEIETRPELFEGPRAGTLADIRGAGGRWRRTAVCEIGREGLAVVARVMVLLEREGTAAAAVLSDMGRGEVPASVPRIAQPGGPKDCEVWVEVGHDEELARQLLEEIRKRVQQVEKREALPQEPSGQNIIEESRQIGREQGF